MFKELYRHMLTSTVINDKMCSEMQGMDHQDKAGKLHQQNTETQRIHETPTIQKLQKHSGNESTHPRVLSKL